MKSFSPAGVAIKAYYGLGARTFGNPDGARSGGGAFAAGGDNPNGPNQGGGGTGTAPMVMLAGSASGLPGDVNIGYQGGWPGAAIVSGQFLGQIPQRFATISDLSGHRFEIIVSCTIIPADFTSVTIVELGLTYLSAAAVFIPGCGINTFRWAPFAPFVFGNTYTVRVAV